MIREIVDPVERERVSARARMFAGSDERHLASEWLARPDIYCVAQENENHGVHHESESLAKALACFPRSSWYLAAVGAGDVHDLAEIRNPLAYLVDGEHSLALPALWTVSPFMLFSFENDAVILYSSAYEFKLVSGSAEFVRSYLQSAQDDPIAELRDLFHENMDWCNAKGQEDSVVAIRHTLDTALSQVKLPPQ